MWQACTLPYPCCTVIKAFFSREGILNIHNAQMWALNNPRSLRPQIVQRFTVNMWRASWGTVYSVHTSYLLNWTLTSISSFCRRYSRNYFPMSLHVVVWGFNKTGRHLIMNTIWIGYFQTGGLGMVVKQLGLPDPLICLLWIFFSGVPLRALSIPSIRK